MSGCGGGGGCWLYVRALARNLFAKIIECFSKVLNMQFCICDLIKIKWRVLIYKHLQQYG